uniref:Uncharacterized protein n=1 Tax=viral metagenome TaxID=1070528 RepID=A0A6C0KT23_9ZZZZ
MSNMFQEVLTNAKAVEEKYIGPDYPYYKYIKTPSEMGMTDKGSLSSLGKDIDGLKSYVELLVSGSGNASATGQPLGNKFFLNTNSKCSDKTTGQDVDRYIYINNVPAGNIPIISSGIGVNFSEFKGLIPGTISNLNAFNPMEMFQAFLSGSKPECQEIKMETIDIYNNKSTESHFVTTIDIQNMDPCIFQDKTNPITNNQCRETFSNLSNIKTFKIPDDSTSQLYFASLGFLGIYILYKIMLKNDMIPK